MAFGEPMPANPDYDKNWEDMMADYKKKMEMKNMPVTQRIVGTEWFLSFTVSNDIAQSILMQYDKEKMSDLRVSHYTIETIEKVTMLLGLDKDNIILWAVEIPEEVPTLTHENNFEEKFNEFSQQAKHYRKIRWIVDTVMIVAIAAVIGLLVLINK